MKETIKVLALAHISTSSNLQMRVDTNQSYIDELAEVAAAGREFNGQLPVVYNDGRNNWLSDGYQRLAAHEKSGVKKMKCLIRQGTLDDAFMFALSANAQHGARRTNADKRKAVESAMAHEKCKQLSDRAIADLCGVSHFFVASVRKASTGSECQLNQQRTGKDGKTRSVPVSDAKSKPELTSDDDELSNFMAATAEDEKPETSENANSDNSENDAEFKVVEEKKTTAKKEKDPLAAASEEFCGKVNQLTRQIDGIVRECDELKSDPLGFDTHWDSIRSQLQAARKALHIGRAKFKCPYCKGAGEKDGNGDCKPCKTTGYLGKSKYLSGCKAVGVPPEEDED